MIAGLLMVLTGCFRNVEAAYKTINWETIVLFAAMLPMSLALEKTGASEYISNSLVSGLGSYGPIVLMAGIYFTTSLMTMFISNTVPAVLMAPIALQSAVQIGVSPVPCLFGDAGSTIYIHGLYKSGAPVADYYGSGDGICVAVAVSFLDIFLLIGKNTLIG